MGIPIHKSIGSRTIFKEPIVPKIFIKDTQSIKNNLVEKMIKKK